MFSTRKDEPMEGRSGLKRKLNVGVVHDLTKEPRPYNVGELKSLSPYLFEDDSLTVGGLVKSRGEVLMQRERNSTRPPNTSCRIETFARMCQSFDDRKRRWVVEMGFAGLLKFVGDMHLPRQLSYWLLTRIDPFNRTLKSVDRKLFNMSKNQVHWVLGIPNRGIDVPTYKSLSMETKEKVDEIMARYGKQWLSKFSKTGRQYKSCGIPVTRKLLERMEVEWQEHEGEEFKLLFLLLSLEMLLCPTQSSRLASDLVPALTCASRASEYDWCSLVLNKLMDSVATFARRFYCHGYASGCGGCLIFAVVMYLDRLDRQPVHWGVFPRIEVWSMDQIGRAVKADRLPKGDFGVVGTLDVAYGEKHPRLARDTDGPQGRVEGLSVCLALKRNNRAPRCMSNSKNLRQYKRQGAVEVAICSWECKSDSELMKLTGSNASVLLDLVAFKMGKIRSFLYFDVAVDAKLVSGFLARFGSNSRWCLAKYPFSLYVFVKFRRGAFILNESMSPAMDMMKGFLWDGCCRVLAIVSHVVDCNSPTMVDWVFVLKNCSPSLLFVVLDSLGSGSVSMTTSQCDLFDGLVLRLKNISRLNSVLMMVTDMGCVQ